MFTFLLGRWSGFSFVVVACCFGDVKVTVEIGKKRILMAFGFSQVQSANAYDETT